MGRFFGLSGRIGRGAYLGRWIALAFLMTVLVLATLSVPVPVNFLLLLVTCVAGLGFMVSNVCLAVRRLHDLDLSGWHYAWMVLLPSAISGMGETLHSLTVQVLGLIASLGLALYLIIWPGTAGPNRFGRDS